MEDPPIKEDADVHSNATSNASSVSLAKTTVMEKLEAKEHQRTPEDVVEIPQISSEQEAEKEEEHGKLMLERLITLLEPDLATMNRSDRTNWCELSVDTLEEIVSTLRRRKRRLEDQLVELATAQQPEFEANAVFCSKLLEDKAVLEVAMEKGQETALEQKQLISELYVHKETAKKGMATSVSLSMGKDYQRKQRTKLGMMRKQHKDAVLSLNTTLTMQRRREAQVLALDALWKELQADFRQRDYANLLFTLQTNNHFFGQTKHQEYRNFVKNLTNLQLLWFQSKRKIAEIENAVAAAQAHVAVMVLPFW